METEDFIRKWESIRSKDMVHYALFNGVIAALAFLGFVVFFHSVNGGNGRIINDFGEYVFGCAAMLAGSAIGSCLGWKEKEYPYQEGEAIWQNMKNK